jgi:hypothetical protein
VIDGEKWVMQQWISKDTSNVVQHPKLLAYLPLGSGASWGIDQLADLAGEHGRVRAIVKKSLKETSNGIGFGMRATILKGKCASVAIGGHMDQKPPRSAGHALDKRSVKAILASATPGRLTASVFFRLTGSPEKGKVLPILQTGFKKGTGQLGKIVAHHTVQVGKTGKLEWVINGNVIPYGDHFSEIEIIEAQWYQVVIQSGPSEDGESQQDTVFIGQVDGNTLSACYSKQKHKEYLPMIAKIQSPDVHSKGTFVSPRETVVGGCPPHHKGETKVDMHVQDLSLFAHVLSREELRFLTKGAYQYKAQ